MEKLRSDKLSQLSKKELLDFLVLVENYDLEYRDTLNLDYNVTFGIEIEYERMIRQIVKIYLNKNFDKWLSKEDASLTFGGEVISPIMHDQEKNWQEIKKICNYLKKRKVITTGNAGGHIHIGAHILKDDYNTWRKFIKTYTLYEDVLFRFLYGDKISPRCFINKYARPIADTVLWTIDKLNEAKNMEELRRFLPVEYRMQSLNLTNVKFYKLDDKIRNKNTIEFRCPNSTVEEVVWQNNINALTKLIIAATKSNFDEEFINYQIASGNMPRTRNYYTYNEVMLKKVLEFTDLIFENNLDKIYFLRQYIKNFDEIEISKKAFKAKRFIKKL